MVPSIPPSAPTQHNVATIFQDAFSHARQLRFTPPTSIENAPNEACGVPIDPNFDGLYVWTNNVNTLSLQDSLADLHELCRQFKEHNIGIAALQQLNIDLSQASSHKRVCAVFDSHFDKQCTLVVLTTHIRSATTWKPGSTLIVVMPTWSPYVVSTFRDELGRWCSVTIQVKDREELVFYSLKKL
jgi:hypothetical protein